MAICAMTVCVCVCASQGSERGGGGSERLLERSEESGYEGN